jgi:ABC-type Fe3+ transport system permease subunit
MSKKQKKRLKNTIIQVLASVALGGVYGIMFAYGILQYCAR